jgi:hypothetical protein
MKKSMQTTWRPSSQGREATGRTRITGHRGSHLLQPSQHLSHAARALDPAVESFMPAAHPRRRGGRAPRPCDLQGFFGGEPAPRDAERLRRNQLISNI